VRDPFTLTISSRDLIAKAGSGYDFFENIEDCLLCITSIKAVKLKQILYCR